MHISQRILRQRPDKEKEAEREKKKDVLKRRSDKEYEAYWQRQGKQTAGGINDEQAVLRAYYSLKKNETLR